MPLKTLPAQATLPSQPKLPAALPRKTSVPRSLRHGFLHGIALATLAALGTASAHAAVGEYWEITSKMEMPGMPMALPANTVKVCIPKGGERDPRHGADKDCVVSDVQNSGNKTSWKIQCNTKDGVMTGVGESTSTPDNTEGKLHLSGNSGGQKIDLTTSFKNKRIGGTCDPDDMKKMVKDAQAMAQETSPPASAAAGTGQTGSAAPAKAASRPELPPNMNPAGAILDSAKRLKGLFGF